MLVHDSRFIAVTLVKVDYFNTPHLQTECPGNSVIPVICHSFLNLSWDNPFMSMFAIIFHLAILQFHSFITHFFSNKVVLNIHMLYPAMKLWILGHTNCSLIILKYHKRSNLLILQVTSSRRIQITSWPAQASAKYSASGVDKATHVYFLLHQLIAVPSIRNIYPDVDL